MARVTLETKHLSILHDITYLQHSLTHSPHNNYGIIFYFLFYFSVAVQRKWRKAKKIKNITKYFNEIYSHWAGQQGRREFFHIPWHLPLCHSIKYPYATLFVYTIILNNLLQHIYFIVYLHKQTRLKEILYLSFNYYTIFFILFFFFLLNPPLFLLFRLDMLLLLLLSGFFCF